MIQESSTFISDRLTNVHKARTALNKRITEIDKNNDKINEMIQINDLAERTLKLNQQNKENELLKQRLAEERKQKEKLLLDINKIKGSQVVKINSKKVEFLTSNDIDEIAVGVFEEVRKKIELK